MVYQRLCGVEKTRKVARIVCIRKLLTTLDMMRTDRARWRSEPAQYAGQARQLLKPFLIHGVEKSERKMRAGGDQQGTPGGEKSGHPYLNHTVQGAGFSPGTLSKPSRDKGRARARG